MYSPPSYDFPTTYICLLYAYFSYEYVAYQSTLCYQTSYRVCYMTWLCTSKLWYLALDCFTLIL
jgi:hypothetical protein